jgi:hypothetical protein
VTKLTSTIKAMGILRMSCLRLSFNHSARAPKDSPSGKRDFASLLQVIFGCRIGKSARLSPFNIFVT